MTRTPTERDMRMLQAAKTALKRRLDGCNANYIQAVQTLRALCEAKPGTKEHEKALAAGNLLVAQAGTLGRYDPKPKGG